MTFQEICESKYGKKIVEEIPLTAEFKQIDIRKETQTLKDGTVLVSYISFPVGDYKALPVIFLRTPYGVESLRFFHEMSFWGYICVAQCCRGTGGSSGIWEPAKNEIADGLEALGWLIKQPWCNGKIAMTGSSYLSMNQWVLADKLPKEVKTLNIEAYSPYRHALLYTDKMFHLEAYAGWTAYNHGVKNPICPQEKLYGEILKFKPQIKMDETLLGKPLKWYRKWLLGTNAKEEINHTGDWKCLEKMPKALSVPTLFFGGYHDPHFEGMVKAWGNISEETKK
ncbi:MAG: CocE/NonD family hydrolase, partial [Anaerotignaceae bacterium]